MTALPADIGALTTDGVVISTDAAQNTAIRALHIDAQPDGDPAEIEMFYTDPADGQFMLNEKWGLMKKAGPGHVGVELDQSIGLGNTTPINLQVPSYTIQDEISGTDTLMRVRSFAQDMSTDRYSTEFLE